VKVPDDGRETSDCSIENEKPMNIGITSVSGSLLSYLQDGCDLTSFVGFSRWRIAAGRLNP
jgi:hypothetical protein